MNSELLRVVEREAGAEAERLLAEARSQAERILEQARGQAGSLREEHRQRAEAEEKAAEARARSAANLEAQALLLEAKSRALESLFAEAAGAMGKLSAGQRRKVLGQLMAEAAREISGPMLIEVSPEDLAAAKELAKELKLNAEMSADPKIKDGVVARSAQGSAMVLNRVSDRLAQARPLMTAEIAKLLWG